MARLRARCVDMADHVENIRPRIYDFEADVGMRIMKNAEDLICKGLSDNLPTREIKNRHPELTDPGQHSFCLRARNHPLSRKLRHLDRNVCFIESEVFHGEGVIDIGRHPAGFIVQLHPHGRPSGSGGWTGAGERQTSREYVEGVKHLRSEKDAFPAMLRAVRGELAFAEFQDRLALIGEVRGSLNLPEDPDSVVADFHFRVYS